MGRRGVIFARRRTLVVWGLRAPARVTVDGGVELGLNDPRDAAFVDGFVSGLRSLPRIDFARRLWSGRLAEFLGDRPFDGWDAYRLDIAVRGLGFRRRVERLYRGLEPAAKAGCEAWATGVNAWIDQSDLPRSKTYRRLGSLPRLVGGADAPLLHRAPAELFATTAGLGRAGELFERLKSPSLHAPGGLGDADLTRVPDPLPFIDGYAAPTEVAVEVLPEHDGHLYVTPAGPRRLYVDRPDIAVRGAGVRRPWIRRTPQGWLWSDDGAADASPPTGPGSVLVWPRAGEAPPAARRRLAPLPPGHPLRIHDDEHGFRGSLRLVPKRG